MMRNLVALTLYITTRLLGFVSFWCFCDSKLHSKCFLLLCLVSCLVVHFFIFSSDLMAQQQTKSKRGRNTYCVVLVDGERIGETSLCTKTQAPVRSIICSCFRCFFSQPATDFCRARKYSVYSIHIYPWTGLDAGAAADRVIENDDIECGEQLQRALIWALGAAMLGLLICCYDLSSVLKHGVRSDRRIHPQLQHLTHVYLYCWLWDGPMPRKYVSHGFYLTNSDTFNVAV